MTTLQMDDYRQEAAALGKPLAVASNTKPPSAAPALSPAAQEEVFSKMFSFAQKFEGQETISQWRIYKGKILDFMEANLKPELKVGQEINDKWCGTFALYIYDTFLPGLYAKSDFKGKDSTDEKWHYYRAKNFKATGEQYGAYRPYTKENGWNGYVPQIGDTVFFKRSHVGIVQEYNRETGALTLISGNKFIVEDNIPATPSTSYVMVETLNKNQLLTKEEGIDGVVDVRALAKAKKIPVRMPLSLPNVDITDPHASKQAPSAPVAFPATSKQPQLD